MKDSDDKPRPRRSQSAQLVDLALAQYKLGISDQEEPFGTLAVQPHIALPLRGGRTGLRAELARKYFELHNAVPSQQALSDACMVLEGRAAQQDRTQLHLRVAQSRNGAVYLDLGDSSGRIIEISEGSWKIVGTAPVMFRRTKLTGRMSLPHPVNGDLDGLWHFVPIDESDRPIVLAFLVAAWITPDAPHPILALLAEQGSAKSSVTRTLVDLVDPSPVPLRKPPRDPDSWVTAAAASWVVALDNLSGNLQQWLSDSLCRASTGDGDVRRALYTDADVAVLKFRRCLILNGVDLSIDQGDLGERIAAVDLGRIPSHRRRTEQDLSTAWEQARRRVFTGLLDLAATVHKRLPQVRLDDLPRMADFGRVLQAIDEIHGTSGLQRYRDRMRRLAADTLGHPFIAALIDQNQPVEGRSSAELLRHVESAADPDWRRPRDWPKSARTVTGLLTRHAPAMRSEGWVVENDGSSNKRNVTLWRITPPEKYPGGASPPSPTSSLQVSDFSEARQARQGELGEADASLGSGSSSLDLGALTSNNEAASLARHAGGQSLDLTKCVCGVQLNPTNTTGTCAECRLTADQRDR
ncbi:ATP-binding protein [Mycobacterium marinum]|uniref:ATP-binding protein n=1 Tax=Mycobacterium marinum TaxID=1781 RepID=UPI0015950952|nr:ATP-binding protein [Mycobacterium marinum]